MNLLLIYSLTIGTTLASETTQQFTSNAITEEAKTSLELTRKFRALMELRGTKQSPGHRAVLNLLHNYSLRLAKNKREEIGLDLKKLKLKKQQCLKHVSYLKIAKDTKTLFTQWSTNDLFAKVVSYNADLALQQEQTLRKREVAAKERLAEEIKAQRHQASQPAPSIVQEVKEVHIHKEIHVHPTRTCDPPAKKLPKARSKSKHVPVKPPIQPKRIPWK